MIFVIALIVIGGGVFIFAKLFDDIRKDEKHNRW
jgi:hypothetical protein